MTGPMIVDSKGVDEDQSKVTVLAVLLVVFSAISGLLFGYDTGVVSAAMLLVRQSMSLDNLWHELIVSGTIASAWVFSLSGGYLTDRFGRRRTILTAAFVFTAGSLVMGLANSKELLLLGRVIVGVGVGLASMSTPMYISECSAAKFRGVLVTLYTLGTTGGQFVAGIIGGLLSEVEDGWRWMLGLAAVPSIILFVGFLFLPESPRYLVAQGDEDAAQQVLQRLRGPEVSVMKELMGIREACDQEKKLRSSTKNGFALARILKTTHARRALILGCALQAYQQLGGINTVMYYSATIIKMAGIADDSTAIWLSAVTAGVNCICTVIGLFLVERLGRRPLTLVSLLGAALSLVVLGGSFLLMNITAPDVTDLRTGAADACTALASCVDCTSLSNMCGFCSFGNGSSTCWPRDNMTGAALAGACQSNSLTKDMVWSTDYCPSNYSWMAVAGLVIYLFCFAPGMGPMPWVVNSEIHPMWARDTSISVATSTNWALNFAVSLSFLSLITLITAAGAFFLFACITLSGVVLMWFIMPETSGYRLEEIESLFGGGKENNNNNNNIDAPLPNKSIETVSTIGT